MRREMRACGNRPLLHGDTGTSTENGHVHAFLTDHPKNTSTRNTTTSLDRSDKLACNSSFLNRARPNSPSTNRRTPKTTPHLLHSIRPPPRNANPTQENMTKGTQRKHTTRTTCTSTPKPWPTTEHGGLVRDRPFFSCSFLRRKAACEGPMNVVSQKNLHSQHWKSPVSAITDHHTHASDIAASPRRHAQFEQGQRMRASRGTTEHRCPPSTPSCLRTSLHACFPCSGVRQRGQE